MKPDVSDSVRLHRAARARQAVAPQPAKMTLAFRCVDVPSHGPDFDDFTQMVESGREIGFATFSRLVDWKPLARQMGYATERGEPGLRLDKDYAVRFYTARLKDERNCFMVHSAIEYVFKRQAPGQAFKPARPWG